MVAKSDLGGTKLPRTRSCSGSRKETSTKCVVPRCIPDELRRESGCDPGRWGQVRAYVSRPSVLLPAGRFVLLPPSRALSEPFSAFRDVDVSHNDVNALFPDGGQGSPGGQEVAQRDRWGGGRENISQAAKGGGQKRLGRRNNGPGKRRKAPRCGPTGATWRP